MTLSPGGGGGYSHKIAESKIITENTVPAACALISLLENICCGSVTVILKPTVSVLFLSFQEQFINFLFAYF